jgi:hypothetical protein
VKNVKLTLTPAEARLVRTLVVDRKEYEEAEGTDGIKGVRNRCLNIERKLAALGVNE